MIKVIEIVISPDGQSRVETKGFAGSECRSASQFIEQAIGTRTQEQLTKEFYQEHTEQSVFGRAHDYTTPSSPSARAC